MTMESLATDGFGQVAMVEAAAIGQTETPGVFFRDVDRCVRPIGALDMRLRLRGNSARDGAAAGADIEDTHGSANEADGIVHQVLGLRARHEHGFGLR